MPSLRAFFAIDLPDDVQKEILHVQEIVQRQLPGETFRWTRQEHLHVTLQFLKKVNAGDKEKILASVSAILAQCAPFTLKIGALELFPTPHHPRVISLNVSPLETLSHLAQSIGQGILDAHYPIETRVFRPHLTIARCCEDDLKFSCIINGLHNILSFFVTEVVFFQSTPLPGGSRYDALARLKLGTGRC